MNKIVFTAVLLLAASSLFALELDVTGTVGNLNFDKNRESPLAPSGGSAVDFEPSFYGAGRIALEETVGEVLTVRGQAERDPVLGNQAQAELVYRAGNFIISGGPLFGVFNSDRIIQPGLTAGFGLEFPGILMAGIRASWTFGEVRRAEDYRAGSGEIYLGFWLPNILSTFRFSTKNFEIAKSDDLKTEDALWRLQYSADVFAKGVPYTLRIDMGYQNLTRTYRDSSVSSDESDKYHSIFLGFEAAFNLRQNLKIKAGAEAPVYSWGRSPLSRPDKTFFFQAHGGFVWTLGE